MSETTTPTIQVSRKLLSYPQLLTILFVLLKVFGKITWSWWFVFAPLWAPLAAICAVVLVGVIFTGIGLGGAALLDARDRRLRRKAQVDRAAGRVIAGRY